jgi:hypothetical protein
MKSINYDAAFDAEADHASFKYYNEPREKLHDFEAG